MSRWASHICNARGHLSPFLPQITAALTKAEARCTALAGPVALDITVRAADWPLFDGMSVAGSSFGPARIDLGIATDRAAPGDALQAEMQRVIFHEFHHVLRWDGPGYGRQLGQALVSEGLAQVFVHEAMTCAPEPWEAAVGAKDLSDAAKRALAQFNAPYDHAAWFFGAGEWPRWTGYSLGFAIVQAHLKTNPEATALSLADSPAEIFYPVLESL